MAATEDQDEALKSKIREGIRDQATVDLPLIGKQSLFGNETIDKFARPIADFLAASWAKVQQLLGYLADKFMEWWDPKAHAEAKAKEAAEKQAKAVRAQELEAVSTKLVADVEKDAPAIPEAQKAHLKALVASGKIAPEKADQLAAALDGDGWTKVLAKSPTAIDVKPEGTGFEVELSLPNGKTHSISTTAIAK